MILQKKGGTRYPPPAKASGFQRLNLMNHRD
jgi:hypothetical protein